MYVVEVITVHHRLHSHKTKTTVPSWELEAEDGTGEMCVGNEKVELVMGEWHFDEEEDDEYSKEVPEEARKEADETGEETGNL